MNSAGKVPTMQCRVCQASVPAGRFCGSCGAHASPRRGDGPALLRLRNYAAAPKEHVLLPSVVSSLFPRLPPSDRLSLRVGWGALILTLIAFAMLRWQAPLFALVVLAVPALLVIYLTESDAFHDLPTRTLTQTAGLGAALGCGWELLTGHLVAHSYVAAIEPGATQRSEELVRFVALLGGAALMLVPVLVARKQRPSTQESLDGALIGALGATCFTAVTTLILLAPQLATGPVNHDQPAFTFLEEVGVRGVAVPVCALAIGSMVGATLWFRPSPLASRRLRWVKSGLPVVALVTCALCIALGLIDIARTQWAVKLALYAVVAGIALLTLRITLQAALLNGQHEASEPEEPVLCVECDRVVPDMAFCPNCGVAAQAASTTSRMARRHSRPKRVDGKSENSP
jgi:hypothetical protein